MSTAAVGLLGVVVGALVTGIATYLLQWAADKRRWEREDRTRFRADKLGLYGDFLAEVRFARHITYADTEMISDMNGLISEIKLTSSREVAEAAEELSLATQRWCATGAAAFKGGSEERERRKAALDSAENAFYKVTRIELGIPEA